jgi:6-pyruvoyltetrahydropterin/6-carboxytetrahydropterin synthase
MKQPVARLKKETAFEAAHYLHNPKWSREKNLAVFKRCSGFRAEDPKAEGMPHGHSYRVIVTVEGPIAPDTGFVMDFRGLKDLLNREVRDNFDHKFINKEVEPFKSHPSMQPTAENMALVIFGLVKKPLMKAKVRLVSVEVWETPESCALYQGR